MDLGLNSKTAIITGGSKGIGLMTGRCLVQEGANVVLVARDSHHLALALQTFDA